jgi:hypothetical protein
VTVLLSTVLAAGAAAVVLGAPIPAGVKRLRRRRRGPPPAGTHAPGEELLETLRQKLRRTPPEPPPDPLPEGQESQLVERILQATASQLPEPSPEPVVEAPPETSERRAVERKPPSSPKPKREPRETLLPTLLQSLQPGTPVSEPDTDTSPALPPEPVVVEQLRPSPPKPEPRPEPEPLSGPVVERKEPSPQSPKRQPARRLARRAKANVARCEIRLWRGFVKCQLFAVMAGSEGAFAVSPYFRLREEDTPTAQAEHALAALLANLERAGWTVASAGPIWYRHRLERFD